MAEWKVLVPVEVLEGETIPDSVVDLLGVLPVVVLGYHVLPEQTPPGQARLQFEEQAQTKLDELAESFGETGASTETRLVFTHDEEQTLERVADETGSNAILIPNPAPEVERLLVALHGDVDVSRMTGFLGALLAEQDVAVTLHIVREDDNQPTGQELLGATRQRLEELGVPATAIETACEVSDNPLQATITAAGDHDAVVMGERAPSIRSFLFGEQTEQVAKGSLGPVIVVRRSPEPAETEPKETES